MHATPKAFGKQMRRFARALQLLDLPGSGSVTKCSSFNEMLFQLLRIRSLVRWRLPVSQRRRLM